MSGKKIVVFGNNGRHPAIKAIMLAVWQALEDMGKDVLYCDCMDNESVNDVLDLMGRQEIALGIGCGGVGMSWGKSGGGTLFTYEMSDVPHVSILMDMPYNKCQSGPELPCSRHICTVIDKAACEYFHYAYPAKADKVLFLPLAGMTAEGEHDIFAVDKKYDVAYIACPWMYGLFREGMERPWRNNETHKYIVSLLDDAADYLEAHPENVLSALKFILKEKGFEGEAYLRKMLPYCWDLLLYIKTWRRVKGLELLVRNDIAVDVFADGWEAVPFADKLRLHGGVSYEESLHICAQSKILFQDQGEFNYGANDRTFNAMLNGAVLVTEYSRYLDENFINGQDLFLYNWQQGEKQVRVIHELLQDDCRRVAVAVNAYGKASRCHTWQNRVQRILEAVHLLYGVDI